MSHPAVKTFVMFDLESTGLPSPGNNPSITELCFIALTREEFLTRQKESRVLNKLVICFNPAKKICPRASVITGLHNDALEDLAQFKEQARLIGLFLKNLPRPICLVAHNGNGFDFPLLVAQLLMANEEIPEHFLCVDSLEALRSFDGLPAVPDFVLQRRKALVATEQEGFSSRINNAEHISNISERQEVQLEQNQTENTSLKRQADESNAVTDSDIYCKQTKLSTEDKVQWDISEFTPRKMNPETAASHDPFDLALSRETSNNGSHEVRCQLFCPDTSQSYNSCTTLSTGNNNTNMLTAEGEHLLSNKDENNPQSSPGSSDFVQISNINSETEEKCEDSMLKNDPKSKIKSTFSKPFTSFHGLNNPQKWSYSLESIYTRTFGHKPQAGHNAEGDCLSLLRILTEKRQQFPSWCDQNAVPLRSIIPMFPKKRPGENGEKNF